MYDCWQVKIRIKVGAVTGYYLFGRAAGLNKVTPPGTSRKGTFCAISHVKAQYTDEKVLKSFTVNSICNGESKGTKLAAVKP
jgi:hypothetical protein